jgi:S-adenosylmethionine:tRNA ribosyltransferase-isomerase
VIAADRPNRNEARLLALDANGAMRDLPRARLATLVPPGALVVANDAATLPASLQGRLLRSGEPIEIRLAAWGPSLDFMRFIAIAFGTGDYHTRTEDRPLPPPLSPGDELSLGPLGALIERLLDHPRLLLVRFRGRRDSVLAGLAQHGRPIQYAHVPKPLGLWDVWTAVAADPIAFEPPSAGFVLDWRTLAAWRRRGVGFATLTHAAGVSSTGDAALDARLPFDEPYRIPGRTAAAVVAARSRCAPVIAIGTTVVRALEAAADAHGRLRAGAGVARGRIGRGTHLRVVDGILTGVHQPGESHFELLRAFASDGVLERMSAALSAWGYRAHEFGDSMLIERQECEPRASCHPSAMSTGAGWPGSLGRYLGTA